MSTYTLFCKRHLLTESRGESETREGTLDSLRVQLLDELQKYRSCLDGIPEASMLFLDIQDEIEEGEIPPVTESEILALATKVWDEHPNHITLTKNPPFAKDQKAAHIAINSEQTEYITKFGFSFPYFDEVMGKTPWKKNWWAIIDDHTAITANGIRDLVEHTYTMAGKEIQAFDGSPTPGLHRRVRETIAENLSADYRDVDLHQREVRL